VTDFTCLIYIDCDRNLIGYLIGDILYCVLSTLLIIYFIFYSSIYIFYICSDVICTCTFQFILTHSLGVLTPWICISRSVTIYYWSVIGRGSQTSGGAQSSLCSILQFQYLSFYSLFLLFPWLCALDSVFASFFYSSGIMCGHWYVVLQWDWFIMVDIYSLFWVTLGLAYMREGIFLANIRRRLSSRLCCHVFWEAGRDRIFLVSEPGLT